MTTAQDAYLNLLNNKKISVDPLEVDIELFISQLNVVKSRYQKLNRKLGLETDLRMISTLPPLKELKGGDKVLIFLAEKPARNKIIKFEIVEEENARPES